MTIYVFALFAPFLLRLAAAADYSYFFNNTGGGLGPSAANVSKACVNALTSPLDCDDYIRFTISSDYYGPVGNSTVQDSICNATCSNELTKYRSSVASACAKQPDPLPGMPATYWGDAAISVFNTICLKDPTSKEYCTDYIFNLFANSTDDTDGTELPSSQLCSPCVVNFFRQIQNTSYSNYDENLADTWSTIQKTCKVTYPTAVQPLNTNVTSVWGWAPPGSAYTGGCMSGTTYTVVSGDNCQVIAQKEGVATGTLIVMNQILPDCSNLDLGASICIPPKCDTYLVQSGDTCLSIANATNATFQQLIAWNPTINTYCTNLLSGTNICISPPGGVNNLTTIPGATATQTAVYATTTVIPPSPIASGTTRKCGQYYLVQPGDYCQIVAVNQSISLGLFEAINPSINSGCTNLLTGFYYCVFPTADWNSTAASTTVTAPTTTPSGTTAECYDYYVVQPGDYCAKIEDMFAITFAQLQYWNPSLDDSCDNLALGEAYCVNGAGPTAAASTTAGSAAKRTPAPAITAGARRTGGVAVGYPHVYAARNLVGMSGMAREL